MQPHSRARAAPPGHSGSIRSACRSTIQCLALSASCSATLVGCRLWSGSGEGGAACCQYVGHCRCCCPGAWFPQAAGAGPGQRDVEHSTAAGNKGSVWSHPPAAVGTGTRPGQIDQRQAAALLVIRSVPVPLLLPSLPLPLEFLTLHICTSACEVGVTSLPAPPGCNHFYIQTLRHSLHCSGLALHSLYCWHPRRLATRTTTMMIRCAVCISAFGGFQRGCCHHQLPSVLLCSAGPHLDCSTDAGSVKGWQ
jgi:hypothetical protein